MQQKAKGVKTNFLPNSYFWWSYTTQLEHILEELEASLQRIFEKFPLTRASVR